jgi:hypothetical protein
MSHQFAGRESMKPISFWVRRYLWVTGIATLVILGAQLLKGRTLDEVLAESFGWGLASAAVFIGTRYYYASKNIACALCRVTVDD